MVLAKKIQLDRRFHQENRMKLGWFFVGFFLLTNHQKNQHYGVQVFWLKMWMHFKLFHVFQNAECFITRSTVYLKNHKTNLYIGTFDGNETEV